jgi:hypothetical protein
MPFTWTNKTSKSMFIAHEVMAMKTLYSGVIIEPDLIRRMCIDY